MKESIAKTKQCPALMISTSISALSIAILSRDDPPQAGASMSKLQPNVYCDGSACMMWDPETKTERITTVNPKEPEGDDWIKQSTNTVRVDRHLTEYRDNWVRTVNLDRGDCGLKPFGVSQ